MEVSGRPGPAEFHSAPWSKSHDSYNLTWKVDSYPPLQEVRLLYRKLMVMTLITHTRGFFMTFPHFSKKNVDERDVPATVTMARWWVIANLTPWWWWSTAIFHTFISLRINIDSMVENIEVMDALHHSWTSCSSTYFAITHVHKFIYALLNDWSHERESLSRNFFYSWNSAYFLCSRIFFIDLFIRMWNGT